VPTQRQILLSDGRVMLGGFDYGTSAAEACTWFVDGAADGQGYSPGECVVSPEVLTAWGAWVALCASLWETYRSTKIVPMPEAFPIDAMHTAQGAGVGIDDGERDYETVDNKAALKMLASVYFRHVVNRQVREAFNTFENAVCSCIPERDNTDA
jgi:hypothetical protein